MQIKIGNNLSISKKHFQKNKNLTFELGLYSVSTVKMRRWCPAAGGKGKDPKKLAHKKKSGDQFEEGKRQCQVECRSK